MEQTDNTLKKNAVMSQKLKITGNHSFQFDTGNSNNMPN